MDNHVQSPPGTSSPRYGPVLPSGTLREEEQQEEQQEEQEEHEHEECANASHAGGVPVFRLAGTRGGGLTLGSLSRVRILFSSTSK